MKYLFLYSIAIIISFSGLSQETNRNCQTDSCKAMEFIVKAGNYIHKNDSICTLYLKKAQHFSEECSPQVKVALFLVYANKYRFKKEFETAQLYLDSAHNIIDKSSKQYAELLQIKAGIYKSKSDFDKALEAYNKALKVAEKTNNISAIITINNSIGYIYEMSGDYNNAMKKYHEALAICKKNPNLKRNISDIFINIGALHYNMENHNEALIYFIKAYKNDSALKNIYGMASGLNNIGAIFFENQEYGKSIDYWEKAAELFNQLEDRYSVASCYANIGLVYKNQKQFRLSEKYNLQSLAQDSLAGDKYGMAVNYMNLSSLYLEMKEINKAIIKGIHAKSLIEEIGIESDLLDIYLILSKAHELNKNYDKALQYHKTFLAIKDSVLNLEKNKQIGELEAKYQNKEKQHQIELQKKEIEKKEAEVKQETILKHSFLAGLLLTLVLIYIILKSLKEKRKANSLLTKQNEEITAQKEEILNKNEELQQQKEEILAQSELLASVNKELEKLSIVADKTDNMVIIADKNANIEWVNNAFNKMYSNSDKRIGVGTNIIETSSNPEIKMVIKDCVTKAMSKSYISYNLKGTKKIWLQTTLTPVFDHQGQLINIIAIDSDITKIKEAEEELIEKNEIINHKNKQITDSIIYAQRIQKALFPEDNLLQSIFPQSFIFLKPRDIVSGDFPWIRTHNDLVYFAISDCTGHGVPGALMSMIGTTMLNEIVDTLKNEDAAEVLNRLSVKVREALTTVNSTDTQDDGMDISLAIINKRTNRITISAANHSPLLIKNNEAISIKGKGFSIGEPRAIKKGLKFINEQIDITTGMRLFFFSDGFPDQFGGMENKKYMRKNLEALLFDKSTFKIKDISKQLEEELHLWTNPNANSSYKQMDDIIVSGIEF